MSSMSSTRFTRARFADITNTARVRYSHHSLHKFQTVSHIPPLSDTAMAQTFLGCGYCSAGETLNAEGRKGDANSLPHRGKYLQSVCPLMELGVNSSCDLTTGPDLVAGRPYKTSPPSGWFHPTCPAHSPLPHPSLSALPDPLF